ncbi:hypothetical protein GQ457_10G029590 [Hibiscus cannabinus]
MGGARESGFHGRKAENVIGKNGSEWTVFIDNLSKRVSRGALWELFSHYGKVSQVFIIMADRKPRYQHSTFAFVRLMAKVGMLRAIEKMNNAKIDGRFITVSKARFPASHKKMKSTNSVEVCDGEKTKTCQGNVGSIKEYMGNRRTPAMKREGLNSLFDIHVPAKDIAWIDLSLVGVLKELYDLDFIQKALLSDGINARVARWGNSSLSCIITFKSVFERDDAWNRKEEGLSFWFEHVEPLNNGNDIPLWVTGDFSKPFLGSDRDDNEVRFADEWQSDKAFNGLEHVDIDPLIFLPPHKVASPVGSETSDSDGLGSERAGLQNNDSNPNYLIFPIIVSRFPRFGAPEVENGIAINMEMTDSHAELANGGKCCGDRLVTQNNEFGLAQEVVPSKVGWAKSTNNCGDTCLLIHEGGLVNLVVANSSDIMVASHNSPSFEIVPDSFEGLSDSLNLKLGNGGLDISGAVSFHNSKMRRGSLEEIEGHADSEVPDPNSEDTLGVSFTGGKEAVLKRVCEIKEEGRDKVKFWHGSRFRYSFSPSSGSAGGLICLWDSDFFVVSSQIITERYIALLGTLKDSYLECGFLNLYGPSVEAEKGSFFSDISDLLAKFNLPRCVCGDFNLVLHKEEKLGGPVNMSFVEMFRNFIQVTGLVDLPLKGGSYTWSNLRDPLPWRKMGVLKVLKGAKGAIKEWSGSKSLPDRKCIGFLEFFFFDLELKQAQGLGDSDSIRKIATLRGSLWEKGMSQLETMGPTLADYLGCNQISAERLAELLAYV